MRFLSQKGFSLVEMVIASVILATMATTVISVRSLMAKQTVRLTDKAYATQKAIQMFEELRAMQTRESNFDTLDSMSDLSSYYNPLLTTDSSVSQLYQAGAGAASTPGDSLSGNKLTGGHWRYLRQATILRNATDPTMRQVNVRVWRYAGDNNPTQPGELLAEVGGILRTTTSLTYPTQVMDIYVLGIQNIPGWWGELPTILGGAKTIPGILQATNPGLSLRMHYITRSSYGRDSYYQPWINSSTSTTDTHSYNFPWVYLYPGTTKGTSNSGTSLVLGSTLHYYDPTNPFGALQTGMLNVDGTSTPPSSSQFAGCPAYTCADYFNNGLRYPDEISLYNQVVNAAQSAANVDASVTEISERMLIEGMLTQPQSFENALILNLHGEFIPLPPMRNYSDAAKDPGNTTSYGGLNWRVVTHPEMLYYPLSGTNDTNGKGPVTFRVYTYLDGLNNPVSLDSIYPPGGNQTVPVISVLFDTYMAANSVNVVGMAGNQTTNYSQNTLWNGTTPATVMNMTATVISPFYAYGAGTTQTLVMLFNSPLRCPQNTSGSGHNNSGLPTAYRLYNSEYIPCSPDLTAYPGTYKFTNEWLDAVDNGPKNTARWQIQCSAVTVGQHLIQTYLGPLTTTGAFATSVVATQTQPLSPWVSNTYVWVSQTSAHPAGNFVPPWTERYQFMGDPRDCPYLDVKVGGPKVANAPLTIGTTAAGGSDGPGYNWWFQDFNAQPTDGFYGFGYAGDVTGWGPNQIETDLPRYFQALRQGLLNTTSVFSMICGYSCYYGGYGGEIGDNQPPFSAHIPINGTPWTQGTTSTINAIEEILNSSTEPWNGVTNEQMNANDPMCYNAGATATSWYARSWQGELYPDKMWPVWQAYGNLPTGGYNGTLTSPANLRFYREDFINIHSQITTTLDGFGRSFCRSPFIQGISALLNGLDSNGNTIQIDPNNPSAPGTICSLGATCFSIFGFPLPSQMPSNRTWDFYPPTTTLTWGTHAQYVGPEWNLAPYSTHTTLSIPTVGGVERDYYFPNSTSGQASGGSNSSNDYDSSVIQISANGQKCYFIESGFDYTAQSGPNNLVQIALTELLRTYLDGGQMAVTGAAGHIVQVPLINNYLDQPSGQYINPAAVSIVVASPVTTTTPLTITGFFTVPNGPMTNAWFRYPGISAATANIYTEEYPGYPALTASTYKEPGIVMDFYLEWSPDQQNWYYVNGPATLAATPGVPNSTYLITATTNLPVTYVWNVSNAATFPQGNYWLTSEAYREGYPLHYATDTTEISIER